MLNQILIFIKNNIHISELITSIATLAGIYIAWSGLQQWKKQLRGRTDYEIARRYMRAVLKLRDAVHYVRNPFIPASEFDEALVKNGVNLSEEISDRKKDAAVYSERWKQVASATSDLNIETIDAEISWGKEASKIQDNLRKSVSKLSVAINLLVRGHSREGDFKIIYQQGEKDFFSEEINESVQEIQNYLKKYLY